MKFLGPVFLPLCLVALGPAEVRAATPTRPKLIVILTDDQGCADVGFNGCKDIPTPNLDSIARHGVQFTNGDVSFPECSPSRAGLLTGRYEQRFGHERNPTPGQSFFSSCGQCPGLGRHRTIRKS